MTVVYGWTGDMAPVSPARVQVTGVTTILQNLVRAKIEHGRRLEVGLVKAGYFLQRKSQEVVPVDTGALKNSAFTKKVGQLLSTVVYVGYTQSYAVFVHEILTARHAPPTGAKFLEYPAIRHALQIKYIIVAELEGRGKNISGTLTADSTPMSAKPSRKWAITMLRDTHGRLNSIIRKFRGGLYS